MITKEEWGKLIEASAAGVCSRRNRHPERDLQEQCVRVFSLLYPQHASSLYHAANGGKCDIATAVARKRAGVVAGVPDLCLAVMRHGYGALYIELKTKRGRLSPAQSAWLSKHNAEGYMCVVVRSLDEFIATITKYLN